MAPVFAPRPPTGPVPHFPAFHGEFSGPWNEGPIDINGTCIRTNRKDIEFTEFYHDFPCALVFPTQTMPFEGRNVSVPRDPWGLLQHRYPHTWSRNVIYNPWCWVANYFYSNPAIANPVALPPSA